MSHPCETHPCRRLGRRSRPAKFSTTKHLTAITALVYWLLTSTAFATGLKASLELDSVGYGEPVNLQIEYDDAYRGRGPNLDRLREDFDVLGTRTNSTVRYVDGKQQVRTRWVIQLVPKRTGKLVIPPVELNGQQTDALELTVEAADAEQSEVTEQVFIESELSPTTAYVHAQIVYTLRLFLGVDIAQGEITDPTVQGARLVSLGKARTFSAERDGRPFRVHERRYAVFADEPGQLKFSRPSFRGELLLSSSSAGLSRLFTQGQQVKVHGLGLSAEIAPVPERARGEDWLPAANMQLSEEWKSANGRPSDERLESLVVGVPVTRSIRLSALGLPAESLPEITLDSSAGLKVYPDQPLLTSAGNALGLVGERVQEFAIVPNQVGTLELPALTVRWWDTVRDSARVASLPARTVTVLPAPGERDGAHETKAPNHDTNDSAERPPPFQSQTNTAIVTGAVFAALWLLTVLGWFLSHRRLTAKLATFGQPGSPAIEDPPMPSIEQALKSLQAACRQDDPKLAHRALLHWAAAVWPQARPRSSRAVAARLGRSRVCDRGPAVGPDALWAAGDRFNGHVEDQLPRRSGARSRPPLERRRVLDDRLACPRPPQLRFEGYPANSRPAQPRAMSCSAYQMAGSCCVGQSGRAVGHHDQPHAGTTRRRNARCW